MRRWAIVIAGALCASCSGELQATITLQVSAPCLAAMTQTLEVQLTDLPAGTGMSTTTYAASQYLGTGMGIVLALPRNTAGFEVNVILENAKGQQLASISEEDSVGVTGNTDVPLTIGGACLDAGIPDVL